MKITLKNVATFHENPITLETDKKVNLIYGLNGTGKTTISDFLYCKGMKEKFADCKLQGTDNEKILVYNRSFIQENFYDKDELKGVFTLSKENKNAEDAIEKANEEKDKQQKKKSAKEEEKQKLENEKNEQLDKIRNIVWKIKGKYSGGDRVLGFCFDGLKTKKLLFNHTQKVALPPTKLSQTIENLEEEAQFVIGENAQKYNALQSVNINVERIECDPIFSEVIIGNEDSTVAELIKKLNNSDWVKQGTKYLPPEIILNAEQCPFCQQETITKKIAQDIKSYFDETYEQKITTIKELKNQYEQASLPKKEDYQGNALMQDCIDKFENLYGELERLLTENRLKITSKLNEPSRKIELTASEKKLGELNILIDEVNQKINTHNQQINNKAKTQKTIKDTFWQIIRWNYNTKISAYHEENKIINDKIKQLESDITNIASQIKKQEQEIVEQQQNMINIEESIRNINNGLHELGIEGFSIKKHEKNSYKIVRNGKNEWQYQSLSEGEKMIINFLYFMELCKGKISEEEVEKRKIVIIDDPVSSLSHTYIFNLSQWIEKHFFEENYKHVIVLTHSLYFFHELIRCATDKGLFRLTKSSSKGTQIKTMKQDEIKNEYESYWQVIKDHGNSQATDALLANSMRNILEHFFGFIRKETLSFALKSLGSDKKFGYFKRYMDRCSHSTAINITDYEEINPDHFKEAFKKVFDETGYEEHYKKMME